MSPSWILSQFQKFLIYFGLYRISSTPEELRKEISVVEPTIVLNIEKSQGDLLGYRGLELGNKMKVLVISDSATNKSAASLCVAAGSMQDPEQLPGLAHFCEHMLFVATNFSSELDEYKKYVSEHGGSSNSYAAKDHSCFYFDVPTEFFEGALLRFSRSFIAPLFTPGLAEREVNIVNSEHENNIPNDVWRIYDVELLLADPEHPYSKFPTGNRDTLWNIPRENSVSIREAVMQYYVSAYSANLMSLVVVGNETLDEQQTMTENMFSPVKNYMHDPPTWPKNPYGQDQLQYRVNIISVRDICRIQLIFPVEDTSLDYNSFISLTFEGQIDLKKRESNERFALFMAGEYISHLAGNEGPGSLFSLLRRQSLCSYLSAGVHTVARGNAIFRVTMDLTADGFENFNNVICHLFQYLNLLRKSKPEAWFWEELLKLRKIQFEYPEKMDPIKIVTRLSPQLLKMKMQHILSAGIYSAEFKPGQITQILKKLTPENCNIIVATKEFQNEDPEKQYVEHYYGFRYSKTRINSSLIKEWQNCSSHERLKLPLPNPYIPKKFELKFPDSNQTSAIPLLLRDEPLIRAWLFQGNEFKIPKAQIVIQFYSPLPNRDSHQANLNSMFASAIVDVFTEEAYIASLAGFEVAIDSLNTGLEVMWTGFSDTIPTLVQKVLRDIKNFTLSQKRFAILKNKIIRDLKNWAYAQPNVQAAFYLDHMLQKREYLPSERLWSAESGYPLTLATLMKYVQEFLASLKLEMLFCGNVSKEGRIQFLTLPFIKTWRSSYQQERQYFYNSFPFPNFRLYHRSLNGRVKDFASFSDVSYVLAAHLGSSVTSATIVYFQIGKLTHTANLILEILASALREPCFTQLSSREELGNTVEIQLRRSLGTQGLQILVQGHYHPLYVDYRIHAFLEQFGVTLEEMKDNQFQAITEEFRAGLVKKPKTISERTMLIWSEIKSQTYNFNGQEIGIGLLPNITKSDLSKFYKEYILLGGKERRRLAIHVKSNRSEKGLPLTPESFGHNNLSVFVQPNDVKFWKAEREFYPPVDLNEVFLKRKLKKS